MSIQILSSAPLDEGNPGRDSQIPDSVSSTPQNVQNRMVHERPFTLSTFKCALHAAQRVVRGRPSEIDPALLPHAGQYSSIDKSSP